MRITTVAAALALLSGCATIFTGTTDTLTFAANVPGVRLSIDGRYVGELPLTIEQSRNFMGGHQFIARFERGGFVTQEFKLQREFNTVAILDITSVVTSGGIDLLTGSLMRFAPTSYHVHMLREGQRAASPEFRRGVDAWRFALVNHRAIQRDIARGGGEWVASFAALCGGEASARVEEAVFRNSNLLLSADGPHDLMARVDAVLAASPDLRAYRL